MEFGTVHVFGKPILLVSEYGTYDGRFGMAGGKSNREIADVPFVVPSRAT
jgi:hypothetical protein